jgi:ketosteroid isomerase-like protein
MSIANAAPPAAADQAAFERLAAANDGAWDRKDWRAMTAQYAPDGTLRVGPEAVGISGSESIGKFFRESFARRGEGFRHVTRIDQVNMVRPDLAFADGYVRVEKADGDKWVLVREFSSISLLVRSADGWKLHSVRALPWPQKQ